MTIKTVANYLLHLLSFLILIDCNGQSSNAILGTEHYHLIDRLEVKGEQNDPYCPIHSGIKPYQQKEVALLSIDALSASEAMQKRDSLNNVYLYIDNKELPIRASLNTDFSGNDQYYTQYHLFDFPLKRKKNFLKYFYEYTSDFYTLKFNKFWLKVNPIIYFSYMNERDNPDNLFINTRGIEFRGGIGNKLGFYTNMTENQARFPSFFTDIIYNANSNATKVDNTYLPAVQGVPYFRNFKGNGVDYFNAEGHISFNPIDEINFQFGHGKNFIGNGWRSLILSDNSANALFMKFRTNVWKFQYTNLFLQLVNQFEVNADSYREPKYMALHHLSWNIKENINLSLFEAVIFGRDNGFELSYLNPLIFYRAIERDLGSPDNVMVGLDFKWNLWNRVSIYSQFVLDEWHFDGIRQMNGDWRNKFAFQLGMKYYDVLNINTLDFQIEYNMVRPYLYSHNSPGNPNAPDSPTANFAHYNQPLAHPLGANFHELMLLLRYQPHPQIILEWRTQYAKKGLNEQLDSISINYGGDIFRNYTDFFQLTGNTVAQGIEQEIVNTEFLLTWWCKPNLHFDFTTQLRIETIANETRNTLFFGFSTRLNIGRRQYFF